MAQTESLVVSISEKGALTVKRNIEGIGAGALKAEGSVKLLRTALGGLAALGIAVGITAAIKTMASFGQELSTVGAISRATADQMAEMKMVAQDLGGTTRFSATQAAEGMTYLARAGFDTNEVLASIGPTLQLAQAGALGLGEAADIASNVLTGFNIAATESQRVIDVLALAANSSNTNVQQLGEAMSYVAPVAASLGVSLEETAAAVEVLSNAGIQASRAGTNLTMVMRLMQSTTPRQEAVLKQLGLTTADVAVSEVGLTGAMTALIKAGISTTQVFEYFGRSAAAASVLLRGMEGDVQAFTAANKDAKGTAEEVAIAMDQNLNGALLELESAYERVVLAFADLGAEHALTKAILGLADAIQLVAFNLEDSLVYFSAFAAAVASIKYAAFLKGLSDSVTGFVALQRAAAAGQVTILGSAKAEAQRTAAALAAAEAEAAKTAALIASTKAQQANAVAVIEGNGTEFIRAALLKQTTALEAQHAVQLQAVAAAQTRATAANAAASASLFSLSRGFAAIKAGIASLTTALSLNPLTLGVIALGAAVAGLTVYISKMNKVLDEEIAIEERIYKFQLAKKQAAVQEIRNRKAATKAVQDYIKELELENHLMGLTEEAYAEEVNLTRALQLAKRELTTEEETAIKTLLKQRQLIEEQNDLRQKEAELLASIKGPQQEYAVSEQLLNNLRDKGKITAQEYATTLQKLREEYDQLGSGGGFDEYLAKLREETRLLGANSREQATARALAEARRQAGGDLTPQQTQEVTGAVDAKFTADFEQHLNQLQRETELLSLNSKEKQLQQALDAARAAAGGTLDAQQEQRVMLAVAEQQAQAALNEENRRKSEIVSEILGPQAALIEQERLMTELVAAGIITQAQMDDQLVKLKQTLGETAAEALNMGDVMGSVWSNSQRAIDDFVDTGIFKFKDFARSIISDITKIAAKLVLLNALKSLFGGSIPGVAGFATGGSFMVGGAGGTDSQLVAFRASPNERVDVLTPAQQAAQAQGQQSMSANMSVTIINLVDPSEIPAIMSSPEGQQATLNTISLNGTTVRQAIA